MSVIVGFSQATSPLISPAPGTSKPDGTPLDGSSDTGGAASLFAALVAMIAPGAQPPELPEPAANTASDIAAAVATPPSVITPPELPAAAPADPAAPELDQLTQSEQGKALLRDFAAALKAAKSALDEGKPLDPALEKKLDETVAAIAAYFAGQPLLQPTPVASGKPGGLPAIDGTVPPPADPADAPVANPLNPGVVNYAPEAPKVMQAKIVPDALAKLGDALKDMAAQLEKASPELAKALAKLADRMSVGDIADEVLAQLGLQRTPQSSTSELDQLVAALTAPKPATSYAAAPPLPIAPPALELPKLVTDKPGATRADTRLDSTERSTHSDDIALDPAIKVEAKPEKPEDKPAVEPRPAAATPAGSAGKTADPPAPTGLPADAAAQVAQAAAATAATATRAIHAAYAAPVQQLNLPQVAFEVARQFEAGNTRFQIRLDPAELGRIDVKLDLDKHGTVNARMFVERPETLDLMMRDQRALQQALQQAGLDLGKTNLEFSLRQNPFAGTGADTGSGGNNGQPGFGPFGTPASDESTELTAQTLYRGTATAGGVNLFV